MLDKLKRYRVRQKEGKIGIKLNVKVFIRRLTGIPANITTIKAVIVRGGRIIQLIAEDVRGGISLSILSIMQLPVCFLSLTQIFLQGVHSGTHLQTSLAQSTGTQFMLPYASQK